MLVVASEDIPEGNEILMDYGDNYWHVMIKNDMYQKVSIGWVLVGCLTGELVGALLLACSVVGGLHGLMGARSVG